jgi:hypothetical protein
MKTLYYLFYRNRSSGESRFIGATGGVVLEEIIKKAMAFISGKNENKDDFYLKEFGVNDAYVVRSCRKIEL